MTAVAHLVSQGFRALSPDQERRTEYALAVARAILTIQAVVVVAASPRPASIDPSSAVLAVYTIFAWCMLLALHVGPQRWPVRPGAAHVIDLVAATMMAWGAAETSSPFLLLILFTLLAAAHRWGFVETAATAVAAALLLAVESLLVTSVFGGTVIGQDIQHDSFLMRASPFLLGGLLIAYLQQTERRFRLEGAAVAAIVARADVRVGFQRTMSLVFDGLLQLFSARRLVLVVRENDSGRLFFWRVSRGDGGVLDVHASRLDSNELPVFMFAPAAAGWHALRTRSWRGEKFSVVAVDAEGNRLKGLSPLPDTLRSAFMPFDSVMAVDVTFGTEWTGRLFLVDPSAGSDRRAALALARTIVRQIAPTIANVYSLRRLRSTARGQERAAIARELHDGVIQGVMGVEMQVAALRRRLTTVAPEIATELTRLNTVLRQEVVALRELMQEMKPVPVDPERFVEGLADVVQRFQRETGIAARFVTQLDRVALPPNACREMARIVGEALVNVRRHSGARNVYVRLATVDGDCRLSIDDDGCGFPFAGRVAHAERAVPGNGPVVIGERVRLLGGELTVDSDPGRGSRLEIAVPLSGVAHG